MNFCVMCLKEVDYLHIHDGLRPLDVTEKNKWMWC